MRRFIVVGHRARTSADFSLDDLAGGAGRMDIMARCVIQALLISHGVREDSEIALVLLGPPDPPKTVRFVGAGVRSVNPQERGAAALIRKALERPAGIREVEASPGVTIARGGLEDAVRACGPPVVQLDEGGEDPPEWGRLLDAAFVLSDSRDFLPSEEGILAASGSRRVRLGPVSLHADQCITVIHNRLDTSADSSVPS